MSTNIESRIAQLEKQNRRLKVWGGVLGAFALAATLMSASTAMCKTVWAERLVLRDSSGRDRLMMDAYTGGTPTITMRDEHGKSVARLSWQDGVSMDLLDKNGKIRASMKVDKQGRVTSSNDSGRNVDVVGMIR